MIERYKYTPRIQADGTIDFPPDMDIEQAHPHVTVHSLKVGDVFSRACSSGWLDVLRIQRWPNGKSIAITYKERIVDNEGRDTGRIGLFTMEEDEVVQLFDKEQLTRYNLRRGISAH